MVTFTLNGKTVTSHSPCNMTLLEVLRKEFYLTGVKKGCETGECGYCTPGMILSVEGLLRRNPDPTVEEIKEGIGGNLCRCTGYQQIVEAVQYAVNWRKQHE